MNDKITLEDILSPISVKKFFNEYWGKKHLVLRRDKFKDLFTFKHLNNYINRFPDVKYLNVIDYDGYGTKWTWDKFKLRDDNQPNLNKAGIVDLWKKGKTIIVPLCEYENEKLVEICFELEKYFSYGQSNIYCSPCAGSKSFDIHADSTDNFLFHQYGKVKWTIYNEWGKSPRPKKFTIQDEFILSAGDLLYIPAGQYHHVETIGPRILASIHFPNKPNQTLDNFKITSNKDSNRTEWFDLSLYCK